MWQFLISIRLAWWVLRGFVTAWVVLTVFNLAHLPSLLPTTPAMFVFGTAFAIASVALGRRAVVGPPRRVGLLLVNTFLGLALPIAVISSDDHANASTMATGPASARGRR